MSLFVDVNTTKLSLQLKAISKHMVALADDLDRIENETCDCGGDLVLIKDDSNEVQIKICSDCGEKYFAGTPPA